MFGFAIWILQSYTVFLLAFEFNEANAGNNWIYESWLVSQSRRVAFIFIGVYVLMIGKDSGNFVRTIVFDCVTDKSVSCINWLYLLLPLFQTAVECFALYVITNVILQSNTVIDVFKDCVAMMFILEVGKWGAKALTKQHVGIDSAHFDIVMPKSHTSKTCKEKCCYSFGSIAGFCIYYGALLARLSIVIYGMLYHFIQTYW